MFLTECKKIVRSFLFWLFTAAIVLAYLTQFTPALKAKLAMPTEENACNSLAFMYTPNL